MTLSDGSEVAAPGLNTLSQSLCDLASAHLPPLSLIFPPAGPATPVFVPWARQADSYLTAMYWMNLLASLTFPFFLKMVTVYSNHLMRSNSCLKLRIQSSLKSRGSDNWYTGSGGKETMTTSAWIQKRLIFQPTLMHHAGPQETANIRKKLSSDGSTTFLKYNF